MKHLKLTTSQIAFLALATALNLVGGTIALALKLPFYLDTFGTLLSLLPWGHFTEWYRACLAALFPVPPPMYMRFSIFLFK